MGIDRHRHLFTTSFDRYEDRYVFYDNRSARGVEVTPAERDIYLDGARSDFYRAIIDRKAAFPPRPYWAGLKRMMIAAFRGYDPGDLPPSPQA